MSLIAIVAFGFACAGQSVRAQEPDWTMPMAGGTSPPVGINANGNRQAAMAQRGFTNVSQQNQRPFDRALENDENAIDPPGPQRYAANQQNVPAGAYQQRTATNSGYYWQAPTWQFLPDGLLYKSYIAGTKEPRFASAWLNLKDQGWVWDIALGGRLGLVRYGTEGAIRPQGWQLDIEGAAFPRLDVEESEDLISTDFRFGVPLTWAAGPWQTKFGYYHISSHVGDEFLISNPNFERVNYVRDSIIFGVGYFITDNVRLYGETAYAFHHSVAEPWEFQFGAEYSPLIVNGRRGTPFAAANVQLFQEQDYGGSLNVMAGWQWRSEISDRLLRVGLQYFNGKSSQYSFYNESQELLGFGIWLDM